MTHDVFTPEKRSEVMSRIRSRGNKDTELRMVALLRANGIKGWRRHQRVHGKPDFVFPAARLALFVDGCFWHGCPKPKHCNAPKNRADWWAAKLARTKERDADVVRSLRADGWKVLRFWECDLSPREWAAVAQRLQVELARRTNAKRR